MAAQVYIIEALFADSGSEGEENFEGFNLEDFTNVDKTNLMFWTSNYGMKVIDILIHWTIKNCQVYNVKLEISILL